MPPTAEVEMEGQGKIHPGSIAKLRFAFKWGPLTFGQREDPYPQRLYVDLSKTIDESGCYSKQKGSRHAGLGSAEIPFGEDGKPLIGDDHKFFTGKRCSAVRARTLANGVSHCK